MSKGYLFRRRDDTVEGTDLLMPSVALSSILAALISFGQIIGPPTRWRWGRRTAGH